VCQTASWLGSVISKLRSAKAQLDKRIDLPKKVIFKNIADMFKENISF
jgi:hypothetical protein